MKFSYTLLKRILGPKIPPIKKVADVLNMHSFEVEKIDGDVIDINLPPNRYSDAASHLGIAREIAAIFNIRTKKLEVKKINKPAHRGLVKVLIRDTNLCPRYLAAYMSISKVGNSPKWMSDALVKCGMKSINAVVDIMNYVMLETGQPLHAFDAAKLSKNKANRANRLLIVRNAKKGEKIKTLDDQNINLASNVLVISDLKHPLAIAGIKGGASSGVTESTKEIIIEAANFDAISIYKSSRSLKLITDASIRFSHGVSPELVEIGMDMAIGLIKEYLHADMLDFVDVYPKRQSREVIGFSVSKFQNLIGLSLDKKIIIEYLEKLGFEIINPQESGALNQLPPSKILRRKTWEGKSAALDQRKSAEFDFLATPPSNRLDITSFEDIAEEIVRIYGYNKLKPLAPLVALSSEESNDTVLFNELVRKILPGLGFTEVYLNSFASEGEIEILNPIASDKKYLRMDLETNLTKCISENMRNFDAVKIFEIGKIFIRNANQQIPANIANMKNNGHILESLSLVVGLAGKRKDSVLEIKGAIDSLFSKLGVAEYNFKEKNSGLIIESSSNILGRINYAQMEKDKIGIIAELNAEMLIKIIKEEVEFKPIPKYPAIIRDISLLIKTNIKAGDIIQKAEDESQELLETIDVIDYFENEKLGENKKSITLRLIFRREDRTLTDKEVDEEIQKISTVLCEVFKAEVR